MLLLDEPYRAMDALTKSIMHETLLEMYDRTKVTIFFITHDLEEANLSRGSGGGDDDPAVPGQDHRGREHPASPRLPPALFEEFRVLVEEAKDAVHEEALKAFEAGERELA